MRDFLRLTRPLFVKLCRLVQPHLRTPRALLDTDRGVSIFDVMGMLLMRMAHTEIGVAHRKLTLHAQQCRLESPTWSIRRPDRPVCCKSVQHIGRHGDIVL